MKKRGRPPKQEIQYPTVNYSYILYDLITSRKGKSIIRMPSSSAEHIKENLKFKKVKIKPTKMTTLIKELGHQGAHDYLKKMSPHWVTKEGFIFLERLNVQ